MKEEIAPQIIEMGGHSEKMIDFQEPNMSIVDPDMKRLSQQETYVRDVLSNYEFKQDLADWSTKTIKADPESMLKQVFDEANSVITQNARWDIIPDYKSRAQLKIKILESMGIIKSKQPEIKINFLNMLGIGKKNTVELF